MNQITPLKDEILDYVAAYEGTPLSSLCSYLRGNHGFPPNAIYRAVRQLRAAQKLYVVQTNRKDQHLYTTVARAQVDKEVDHVGCR